MIARTISKGEGWVASLLHGLPILSLWVPSCGRPPGSWSLGAGLPLHLHRPGSCLEVKGVGRPPRLGDARPPPTWTHQGKAETGLPVDSWSGGSVTRRPCPTSRTLLGRSVRCATLRFLPSHTQLAPRLRVAHLRAPTPKDIQHPPPVQGAPIRKSILWLWSRCASLRYAAS